MKPRLLGVLVVVLVAGSSLLGCKPEAERPSSEVRLEALSPEARSALAEAQQALDAGRFDDGFRALDRLDALSPAMPEAALLRGRLLFSIGRLDEAAHEYERALELDPSLEGVRHNLGNIAFQEHRFADAARWYRAEAERFDTPRPWHGLGGAYLSLGRADSARLAFERSIALAPDYVPARVSLAAWHEENGDLEAALALLTPALAKDPENVDLAYQVGSLYVRTGDPDAAVPLLRRVEEAETWNFSALLALGQALQQHGDPEAESVLARAAAVRKEQAVIERLERNVRDAPDDLNRRIALANAYRGTGQLRDALEAYQAALGQRPDNASLLTNIGVLLLQLDMPEAGLDHLRRAVAADSTFGPAWINLWAQYGRAGDQRRAEAAFARARRYAPDHPAVQAFEQRRAVAGE